MQEKQGNRASWGAPVLGTCETPLRPLVIIFTWQLTMLSIAFFWVFPLDAEIAIPVALVISPSANVTAASRTGRKRASAAQPGGHSLSRAAAPDGSCRAPHNGTTELEVLQCARASFGLLLANATNVAPSSSFCRPLTAQNPGKKNKNNILYPNWWSQHRVSATPLLTSPKHLDLD